MSNAPSQSSTIRTALFLWLGHLIVCAFLVYLLCVVMPARDRFYRDWRLLLPAVTQWAVEASAWVLSYGVYVAAPFVLLLLLDGAALFLLWRWQPKLALAWFVLIAVA